jgi:hypothetical protein
LAKEEVQHLLAYKFEIERVVVLLPHHKVTEAPLPRRLSLRSFHYNFCTVLSRTLSLESRWPVSRRSVRITVQPGPNFFPLRQPLSLGSWRQPSTQFYRPFLHGPRKCHQPERYPYRLPRPSVGGVVNQYRRSKYVLEHIFRQAEVLRGAVNRRRCCTYGIFMPFVVAVMSLIIAGAATVAWIILLGYGLFVLIERML